MARCSMRGVQEGTDGMSEEQLDEGRGLSPESQAMLERASEYEYHSHDHLEGEDDGDWSIRCLDVHKRLGGLPVLNGLNVKIPDNTITVVLGPSGTGKSVLIKHIIGLMFPDSGEVIVKGQSVSSLNMPDLLALRRRIGVLFQDGALFGSMSVFDNVAFPCASTRICPRRRSAKSSDSA